MMPSARPPSDASSMCCSKPMSAPHRRDGARAGHRRTKHRGGVTNLELAAEGSSPRAVVGDVKLAPSRHVRVSEASKRSKSGPLRSGSPPTGKFGS